MFLVFYFIFAFSHLLFFPEYSFHTSSGELWSIEQSIGRDWTQWSFLGCFNSQGQFFKLEFLSALITFLHICSDYILNDSHYLLCLQLCSALETADRLVQTANSNAETLKEKIDSLEHIIKRGDAAVDQAKVVLRIQNNWLFDKLPANVCVRRDYSSLFPSHSCMSKILWSSIGLRSVSHLWRELLSRSTIDPEGFAQWP